MQPKELKNTAKRKKLNWVCNKLRIYRVPPGFIARRVFFVLFSVWGLTLNRICFTFSPSWKSFQTSSNQSFPFCHKENFLPVGSIQGQQCKFTFPGNTFTVLMVKLKKFASGNWTVISKFKKGVKLISSGKNYLISKPDFIFNNNAPVLLVCGGGCLLASHVSLSKPSPAKGFRWSP